MKFPHSVRRGGASLLIALSLSLLLPPVRAQRPAPKPTTPAKATTPPSQAAEEKSAPVTFDTLLPADAYGIYAEMRAVGRHANSQEIAQLFAPLAFEGSGVPDELLALYDFVKSHADTLMTSRLMYATMPARGGVPTMLLALEMPSIEEARKFVPELKQFVAANIEPLPQAAPALIVTTATTSATLGTSNAARRRGRARARATAAEHAPDAARAKRPAAPPFQIKRAGSLVVMSDANFTFKDLRRADQALLVNEPGFQAARSRFSTDALFVYFNTVRMNSSTKRLIEAQEKEWRRMEEEAAKEKRRRGKTPGQADADIIVEDETAQLSGGNMNVRPDGNGNYSVTMSRNINTANTNAAVSPEGAMPPPTPEATLEPAPSPLSEKELEEELRREQSRQFTDTLGALVFGGRGASNEAWPESIGVGASLEGDALVVRGLFVSQSEEQPLRPIPFLPVLLSGPSIAAEATAVLPASTDIFVSVSLDLPQMYDYVASLMKIADFLPTQEEGGKGNYTEQLTAFEKTNNFRIREDLLAALGNEIAVGLPGNQFVGGRAAPRAPGDAPPPSGPIVVVALNDRESLQKLLPRVLHAVGFAGATEQSIVEKHGQVEVLTFSNGTLAFIDRFLVGTPDAATMRRVVDAYNNGETLANNERFRDATSWQSRQAVGQVYVANDMLKGMFADVTKSVEDIDDPALRAHIMRLDPDPGSISHLATRESNGLMHELRLPKNLLSLFTASQLVDQKLSTIRNNESMARWKLRMIHNMQTTYKANHGRYGTLEELRGAGKSSGGDDGDPGSAAGMEDIYSSLELDGYDIEVFASGDKFEATATPTGYPKLGRKSFYIDQTGSLRGGDMGGKPATESTPIIE